jgi:mono/diheme cytochrome c family protein
LFRELEQRKMRYKTLLSWVASSILAGLPVSQAAASEVDAAGYYTLRCASCHGAHGEGTRDKAPSLGPPLRGNPFVINAPVEMLMNVIRHGRGGQQRVYDESFPNMPAFDAGMVPDAIGLATYLKTVLQQPETAYLTPDDFGVAVAAEAALDRGDIGVCSESARQPLDGGFARLGLAI